MARRKKKKGTTHRRRRVSGVHPAIKDTLEMIGGAIAGGVAASFVNKAIKASFPTMPAYTGGAVAVVMGGAIPMFLPKSPAVTGLAAGMAAVGGSFAVNETFLSLPGISGLPAPRGFINRNVGNTRMGTLSNQKQIIGNLSNRRQVLGSVGAMYDN